MAVSNGGRLGSWIIGRFHVQLHNLTVESIEGIQSYILPAKSSASFVI